MVNRPCKYGLSPLAVADLEGIWRYTVENWSARQAEIYHAEIVEAFEGLASDLKNGRPADVRDGYFKYAVGSHVIYYLLRDGEIAIIRILHRRMDVGRHL
ncbi:type II toxin-antitoxin system RelE/ParE family toxin [Rhizobium sp. CNPSo 4039]|uniref:type II toxin-antitoxin system RelE/ParE family toxin n=1 Tax=Rhizobium sp. CNPSo 4039 TaxID=3021409 RepID=UPI00254EFD60|nr:type II toxin-antitoxin system RelE/ParE family toxin [Rhizobium sp. CNPSo 4039]MDK4714736.1 type II toxin-antitoxin system RelE/ParE family toxin [Rhizobium sp. CNPSo 4039]